MIENNRNTQVIEAFDVVGISVRTTNENGQSSQDLSALWNTFIAEAVASKIPNKVEDSIYSIYTGYEKDHTAPYTAILGCRVNDLQNIPDGMIGIHIPTGQYEKHLAKGNIMQGAVFHAWLEIWNADLPRAFTADFEVYGEKAQNPEDAEVDIFIAIH